MKNKLIVILPFYNQAAYLGEAIQSILQQSYPNFKLILINDGSSDHSVQVAQKFTHDPRVQLFQNSVNQGQVKVLNQVLSLINTPYWALMHGDDIAHKDRLKEQMEYMQAHPEIALCGTWGAYKIGEDLSYPEYPHEKNAVYCELLFRQVFIHSSLMVNTHLWKKSEVWYRESFNHAAEDYEFISRIAKNFAIGNINQIRMTYRVHEEQESQKYHNIQRKARLIIYADNLKFLGVQANPQELDYHDSLMHDATFPMSFNTLLEIHQWLMKLYTANQEKKIYPQKEFMEVIKKIWYQQSAGQSRYGLPFGRLFSQSPFSEYTQYNFWTKTKFWLKCLLKKS